MQDIDRKPFLEDDYERVYDFFVALNKQKKHMNWNWARWEWGYFHPEFDRSLIPYIGIWLDGERVVGVAAFDMYLGEAFCGALPGYEQILPEILCYAEGQLSDKNGLGIAVDDQDKTMRSLLLQRGYGLAEQVETMLRISLDMPLHSVLPDGLKIREVVLPEDGYQYQLVFWKGFDHGDDMEEFEKTLVPQHDKHPHEIRSLRLAAVDEKGRFVGHCQCWYAPETDYAYVEPVCVIPGYRGMGVGRAVVFQALERCRELGAKEAYVLSDQAFYTSLGFQKFSKHRFYRKK